MKEKSKRAIIATPEVVLDRVWIGVDVKSQTKLSFIAMQENQTFLSFAYISQRDLFALLFFVWFDNVFFSTHSLCADISRCRS